MDFASSPQTIRIAKIKNYALPVFAVIGVVTVAGVLIGLGSMMYVSFQTPNYSEAQYEAMYKARDEADEEILRMECDRKERIGYDQREMITQGAVSRALSSVGAGE